MGLAERRATKEFEDTQYPVLLKQLHEAATFEVPVEVKWETLALEGKVKLYAECWPKVYFEPVISAFKEIAKDAMGREALKGGLKKVVFQSVAGGSIADRCVTFAEGVLTLDHAPCTNIADVKRRASAVQKAVEAAL